MEKKTESPSLFTKIYNEMVKNNPYAQQTIDCEKTENDGGEKNDFINSPCVINCRDDSSDDNNIDTPHTLHQRRERQRQRRHRRVQYMEFLKLKHRQRSVTEEIEQLQYELETIGAQVAKTEEALRQKGFNEREFRRLCGIYAFERFQPDDLTPEEDGSESFYQYGNDGETAYRKGFLTDKSGEQKHNDEEIKRTNNRGGKDAEGDGKANGTQESSVQGLVAVGQKRAFAIISEENMSKPDKGKRFRPT